MFVKKNEFQKTSYSTPGEKTKEYYQPVAFEETYLQVSLVERNHIYWDDLHLVFEPVRWNFETLNYTSKLSVYKSYGKLKKIEELLGTIVLEGYLNPKESLFNFEGFGSKVFYDQLTKPMLQLEFSGEKNEAMSKKHQPQEKSPHAEMRL
jgi:hypothetical protein